MKRKLFLLLCALLTMIGVTQVKAQASFNHTYTEGVTVAAGENYFLYNIGSGRFLTDGMDYGTHASADHAGRVVTLAAATNGYSIYTRPYSANGSAEKAGYMTRNGYIDTGTNDADWVFTPVVLDGYTNAYTIKNSETEYLFYETKDNLYQGKMGAFINVGNSTGDAYSYWLIIPMSARQAVGDCTYLLRNGDFNHPWELPMWTNEAGWKNIAGGKKENVCAEMYGKGFDINQTISATITNGRYKLYNQAFYNNADANNQTYLYANSDQSAIAILNAHGEGTAANMAGASDAFSAGQYVNSVETFVSNGSLKVGIKNATTAGNAWNIMNNFHLEYLGQCVMDYAVALPAGGAMTADTWYYFDIAVAGDNYYANADNLNDIICTDDGYTLTSATSGNTLTAEDNDFAIKRYYVKSSSANHLEIGVASYTYNLGSITDQTFDDGDYVKGLTTFVLTYGNAATNDGSVSLAVIGSSVATLKKGGSTVTTGTLTANNEAKTLTATFDVSLVLNSNDYSIVIPEGAFGYEGHAVNDEVTVNFNTPLFEDGTYYMKNKDNGAYFGAGLSWSSQAMTNTIGHVVDLIAASDGKYSIDTHINNGGDDEYLTTGLFCDGSFTTWTFASDGAGGYTIYGASKYVKSNGIGAALTLSETNSDATTKWTLLTPAQWKAEQVARLDAAAADNGVDATFYIPAANFNRNDNVENAKWQGNPGLDGISTNFNAQKWNVTPFDVYQELAELKPGAYKLTMQGFYRNGTTDQRNAILYANGFSVPLVNIKSDGVAAQDDEHGFTTENSGVYVPNKQDQAAKTFDFNHYNNELWFNVGSDGALRVGVKKTTGATGDWTVLDNFQLTYYGDAINYATIGATGWTTFASAYPLDLSKMSASTGTVKAYYASAVGGENVTMTSTNKADVAAGEGLMLKGTNGATITIPVAASGTEIDGNMLKGCVSETVLGNDATSGYNNYVLVNNGGVAQFQSLSANGATIPAGKAYLQNGTYSAGARLTIILEDEVPTEINAIEAADTKVEGLKDGKYLIGNKIVLVKNGVKYSANGQKLN